MLKKDKRKRKKRFQSLTVSLATTFLTLTLVVLLLGNILEIYFGYQTQRKAIAQQQQFIAEDAAKTVKAFLHEKFLEMEAAANIGNLFISNPEKQELTLQKLIGFEPAFRQLVLLNDQAMELVKTSRLSSFSTGQLTKRADPSFLLEVMHHGNRISPVYIDEVTCEPMIIMAIPVKDVFNDYKGILMAEVNLKFMWDLIGRIKIGNTGVAYVVDKRGDLIAFQDINRVLKGENLIRLHEVAQFVEGDSISSHMDRSEISRGIEGNRIVSNHAHLNNPDWAVVVEMPVSEAYNAVFSKLKISALIIFLCFILAIAAGTYLSKKITRPIIDLRNATRLISKGRLDTQIDIVLNNEIGDLAESFNQMVEDLNKTTVSRDELVEEVHERKKVEEALREAKKQAETAVDTKSQFLANMSHEIRTPMNAIIGFTELLQSTKLDETQEDYVKTMYNSGNLLLALINDVLDLSKVEQNMIELECIDFDFSYLIESVFSMIASKMVGSSVDLLYRIEDGPRYFKGDPTRIRQILINLISNAIKFTEKGEIFTTIGIDERDSLGKGEPGLIRTLRVSIRDTGIGVPENQKEAIFESFTQVDSSTTRKYGGTGLGLSISKALVEKMGGIIWVESEEGKGSEFTFTLKLEQARPIIDAEIEPVSLESLKEKKVIIVDDNPSVGDILKDYCTGVEMDVRFVARSAKEALNWLASEKALPDLIISDSLMPEMDGYEFIKRIREDDRLKRIKTIAATSHAIPGQSMNAKMKGFDAYLSKPVIRKELINVMKTVFGDKRKKGGQIITRHLAEEVAFKGMKVLVVEDNAVNMKLVETLLEKFGFIVNKAINGKEAIEKLRSENSYNIVLMDVQMPQMNGIEATEIIRRDISKDLPVIALTASVMQEDQKRALSIGMNDFITKPINVKRLKEVLQKYCK